MLWPVAYGGRFGRVFTRLATSRKLWRFTSRGGCRLYHQAFEHLNRLAVDHNHQTTRSTYVRTSTAWGTNKNWLISFLVTKPFQLNSLVRNTVNSIFDRVIKITCWLTCNTVCGKKFFLIKESDTKILRSIFRLGSCRHHQLCEVHGQ